jgi:hypothetical protein
MTLDKLLCEFAYNTIQGFESGSYKTHINNKIDIKSDKLIEIYKHINVNYHNQLYRSLIKNDDEYVTNVFGKMLEADNHNHICLLNYTFDIVNIILDNMQRELLDDTSYENYMISVKIQIDTITEFICENFKKILAHSCSKLDITKCNPNLDMFLVRIIDEPKSDEEMEDN